MHILVTGGTGVLGKELVPTLIGRGHVVRVLTRQGNHYPHGVFGDLSTGEGLDDALSGVDAVVHAASQAISRRGALAVDRNGTQRLVNLAERHRISHIVYTSILGVDKIPYGYFKIKHLAERIIATGSVPWTIMRIAQFHELVDAVLFRLSRSPIIPMPKGVSAQPIAAADAGRRIADVVVASPQQEVIPLGGPQIITTENAAQTWLRLRGKSRRIVTFPFPGRVMRGFREGHNLDLRAAYPGIRFEDWLRERIRTRQPESY